MRLEKQLGVSEQGTQAVLVLLDADPLADIHNTRRIVRTTKGGAVYALAPLWTAVVLTPAQ